MNQSSYIERLGSGLLLTAFIYLPFCLLVFLVRFAKDENKNYKTIGLFFAKNSILPISFAIIFSIFSFDAMMKGTLLALAITVFNTWKASKKIAFAVTEVSIAPSTINEKKCPWCAEVILIEAKYCKHCHRDIPEA